VSRPKCSGEYDFAGQYQQAPSPQGGGMIKMVWSKSYGGEREAGGIRPCRAELDEPA
jgi:hypothetical protein